MRTYAGPLGHLPKNENHKKQQLGNLAALAHPLASSVHIGRIPMGCRTPPMSLPSSRPMDTGSSQRARATILAWAALCNTLSYPEPALKCSSNLIAWEGQRWTHQQGSSGA